MQQWPRTRKIVTRIFAAACLLFLLTLAIVQIGQRVLRRRAERLLADLQQLHDGGNTWADMQRLMTRWGKYGHYDGVCTAQNCQYQIDLTDWIGEAAYPTSRRYALIPLVLFVLPAHWHDASLSTFLKFDDGNVTEWRTDFITYVPEEGMLKTFSGGGYGLEASVTETDGPRSSPLWQWPGSPQSQQYSIEPRINCTSCIGIRIHLAPSHAA